MAVEVEVRSFITKEKYEELLEFFGREGELVSEDDQETHYFDTKEDIRIQRNKSFSKIWMKKGKMHDDQREEIEIKMDRNDFDRLEKLFTSLGFKVKIKWFRQRHTFRWQGIDVMLDYTRGYGYIIEMEKMCCDEDKDAVLFALKQKMRSLNIHPTSKDEFDKAYVYYRDNWKLLAGTNQSS